MTRKFLSPPSPCTNLSIVMEASSMTFRIIVEPLREPPPTETKPRSVELTLPSDRTPFADLLLRHPDEQLSYISQNRNVAHKLPRACLDMGYVCAFFWTNSELHFCFPWLENVFHSLLFLLLCLSVADFRSSQPFQTTKILMFNFLPCHPLILLGLLVFKGHLGVRQ